MILIQLPTLATYKGAHAHALCGYSLWVHLQFRKRPFFCISAPVRASSSDATSYPFSPCGFLFPSSRTAGIPCLTIPTSPRSRSGAVARLGSRVRSRSLVRTVHTRFRLSADHRATMPLWVKHLATTKSQFRHSADRRSFALSYHVSSDRRCRSQIRPPTKSAAAAD